MALHQHGKRSARILSDIGHELKVNPPAILEKTRRKSGATAAKQQRVAHLLSRAKKAGAG